MAKRILLIDDDELLCEALAGFLEAQGYEVVQAGNGKIGIDRLAAGPEFDLVVLDLLMPEMDGILFLKSVTSSATPMPPVLVLSASATADVVDVLDFPCIAGIARKPIQPAALLERIGAQLGKG